jgi:hypothetical protein
MHPGYVALITLWATASIPALQARQIDFVKERSILEEYQAKHPPAPDARTSPRDAVRRVILTLKPGRPLLDFFYQLRFQMTQQWCLLSSATKGFRVGLDIQTDLSESAVLRWFRTDLRDIVGSAESGSRSVELQQLLMDREARGASSSAPFELLFKHITVGMSQQELERLMGAAHSATPQRWNYVVHLFLHGGEFHGAVDFNEMRRVTASKLEYVPFEGFPVPSELRGK